jgi:hypothetical protein
MNHFFIIVLIISAGQTYGQNYIDYQRTFNRIDDDILKKNYGVTLQRLDSIYHNYEFIYAKHCIKALQICCYMNDSIETDKWLAKCFKQGVPIWIIKTNELTKKSLLFSTTKNTVYRYDSLQLIYKSSINMNLSKEIDRLFTIDQKYTRKVNDGFFPLRHTIYGLQWLKNNKKQFAIIDTIIDHYGFPGERLIGLGNWNEDSNTIKSLKYLSPVVVEDKRTYFMLIHYYSNPRKDINDKLIKNVTNGYIPAYQFGALNDFMARWGKLKYGNYKYYNVWHQDPNKSNIESINIRRNLIGLNSFDLQKRNDSIEIERRKTKKSNSEIILE